MSEPRITSWSVQCNEGQHPACRMASCWCPHHDDGDGGAKVGAKIPDKPLDHLVASR